MLLPKFLMHTLPRSDIQIPHPFAPGEGLDFFGDGFAMMEDFAADDGVGDEDEEASAFDADGV